jgi:hypothetical protein
MPGDSKYERRLWKIRVAVIASGLAVAGTIYVFRHFFGS